MSTILASAATAAGAFAATNVDDFVVLTALFATVGRGGPTRGRIVAGQYLGIGALLVVSVAAAVVFLAVPERWFGLLGLVPIALGVRGLVSAGRARTPRTSQTKAPVAVPVRGVLGVAGVTVANGGDNLSVYIPLLHRGYTTAVVAVFAVVFAGLIAVWCVLAFLVSGRQPVIALVEATGHWLVPALFIVIGVRIVATSGLLLV